MTDFHLIVLALLAFAVGVFNSGCETALFAADRIRLRHLTTTGSRRAQRVLDLTAKPERFLSTILVGYNLAEVGCTALCTALAARHFGDSATTIVTITLVPVWLLFNQIIPKGLILSYATQAAVASVDVVRLFSAILYPVSRPIALLTNFLTRSLPVRSSARLLNVTQEELLFHIGDSRSAGLIAPETTALIDRAIELKELTVREVMLPLASVVMLDADAPAASYAEVIAREKYSRYPAYRGERSNVVGVVSVHEYVTAHDREALRRQMRPPYAVAGDARLSDVLLQMREGGRHMALVSSASGACIGITTLDDILKRVVGVIVDEFD